MGSNSKLFTALSIGTLIEDPTNSLDWTTKIADILPEWELQDPVASQHATIQDILSHRTGLPRHELSYSLGQKTIDVVLSLRHLSPSAEFREVWQYNNCENYLPSCHYPY